MVLRRCKHATCEVIEAPCNVLLSNKMEITERRNLMALRAEVSRNTIFFSVKMRKFSDYFRIFPIISAFVIHSIYKRMLEVQLYKKQKGFVKA